MNKYKVGELINNILFVAELPKQKRIRYGLFECPFCLEQFKAEVVTLAHGKINHCGCQKHRQSGKNRTPEYRSWSAMKDRCLCVTNKAYPRYGGVGIKICERWMKYENFYNDMGPRPSKDHTLDRYPNQNGDYEPSNCRWANWSEQAKNRKNTILVVYNGCMKPLIEVCEEINLEYTKLRKKNYGKHKTHQEALDYWVKPFINHSFGYLN